MKCGIGAAAITALAGGGVSLWHPGIVQGRLSTEGRQVFRAVGRAVLDGCLPRDKTLLGLALDAHLERLHATVAALSPAARVELSRLLALLSTAPGRIAVAGVSAEWSHATMPQLQETLEAMRTSSIALRQQAYHALRDLTMAAYFSDRSSWELLGYPGPLDI